MRWLVIVALAAGCADQKSVYVCDPPASSYGSNCACFDGEVRCDDNPRCPSDLSVPCKPADTCGDLSGGSDGGDCICMCTAAKTWSCMGHDGDACNPM